MIRSKGLWHRLKPQEIPIGKTTGQHTVHQSLHSIHVVTRGPVVSRGGMMAAVENYCKNGRGKVGTKKEKKMCFGNLHKS